MKQNWIVIGIVLILAGSVFTLQGMNILLGSFMSRSSVWLAIGVVLVIVGAVVLVVNRRGRG